jgi:hypothetical protein
LPLNGGIGGARGVAEVTDLTTEFRCPSGLTPWAFSARSHCSNKRPYSGQTVVLAEVDEQNDEVVDQAMARLGGRVLRRSVDDVEAEIAAHRS